MGTNVSGVFSSYIQVVIVIDVTDLFLFSRLVATIRYAKPLHSVQTITTSISNSA